MATTTEATLSPRASSVASPGGGRPAAVTTGADASSPAPAGFHGIRRSMTVDEGTHAGRWRPQSGEFNPRLSFDGDRRRSSTFSDYSLSEAKRNLRDDVLDPGGAGVESNSNNWSWLPLLFALLPPVGGILHKDGSSVITDLMLLGLAAVFLNWSVTQPWAWYQSAQEVRVREEMVVEMALEDDSDDAGDRQPSTPPRGSGNLDDVPEEGTAPQKQQPAAPGPDRGEQARRALEELYMHEVMALLMCFGAPVMAAFLLHGVRNMLSRPSEGLVSNYNLTIFLLAAEIAPLSHLIKLVQARTLHLQRIVHTSPFRDEMVLPSQVHDLAARLEELEARMVAVADVATTSALTGGAGNGQNLNSNGDAGGANGRAKLEAAVARSVRNSMQPELDALNRAVRRYEKKATVLASLTDARLANLDARLNDAISLAAAAAKMRASRWSVVAGLGAVVLDRAVRLAMLPAYALIGLCMIPIKVLTIMLGGGRRREAGGDGNAAQDKRGFVDGVGIYRKGGSVGGGGGAGAGGRGGFGRGVSTDRMASKLMKR